ncbi:phage tail protein [Bacillus sp. OTU530]|uniref:phage tail protein n=1 Tax=Bacillus sp. OTU530 TaxID=3043862 RepID=UPI00313E3865
MLIIKSLNGQEEMLTDYTPPERKRRVNGDNTLYFSAIDTERNSHSYPLCEEEAVVMIGSDEYKIKSVRKSRTGRKQVDCVHIFLDDMINAWQYDKINGYTNFVQALNHVFAPTSWEWVNQTATVATEFENWGDDNCLSLLQTLLDRYKVEFEIDNVNKQVYFKTAIGTETDAQFRWKHNIKSYEYEVDTKNLSTIIKGYGKDGITTTYRSTTADLYGEKHAKPLRDERYTTVETLLQACKDSLIDVPELRLKTDIVQLYENGLPVHNYDVGDYVFALIDPIDLQVKIRIIEITDYPLNKEKSPIVELSNLHLLRKGITSVMTNFAQVQKNVKDLLDENGNLQLSIKKLYRNSNHYSDNTGDWYISEDDPNAFVHIGAGGLDIHKGLVRVERDDGYATIIGGKLQHGLAIQSSNPAFQTTGVEKFGSWYRTLSTSRFENVDRYTLKHDSRYVHVVVDMFVDGGITGYITFDVIEEDESGVETVISSSTVTETRHSTNQGYKKDILIDLGVPTGNLKTIYWRQYGSVDTYYVYGNVRFIEQEG